MAKTLSEIIESARGDLSVTAFAQKCGVNASTMYRIQNGEMLRPSPEIIDAVYENRAPYANFTKEELNEAVTNASMALISARQEQTRARAHQNEQTVKVLFYEEFMKNGIPVKPLEKKSEARREIMNQVFDLRWVIGDSSSQMLIQVDIASDLQVRGALRLDRLYSHIGRIVLASPPEEFSDMHWTYLVFIIEEDDYPTLQRSLANRLTNTQEHISVVLLEQQTGKVLKEYVLGPESKCPPLLKGDD